MKIAILTSGILPVPAVQGGAVETLVDFYLDYNERHHLHDITVYSVAPPSNQSSHLVPRTSHLESTHYHYITVSSPLAKLRKQLFRHFGKGTGYYHYTIEYFLEQALRHLKTQHYDLIILENRPGYALRLQGQTQTPLVYHLHNDFLNVDTPHAAALLSAAHRIVNVSDFITRRVQAVDPRSPKSVTVYNGIDTRAFSREENAPVPRSQFGLRDDDFVIVYSGRINPEKGIAQLIEAMQRLGDRQDIKLLIIGSSFYGNSGAASSPFIEGLKQQAVPLADRIIFTGFIPYAAMPRYLGMADCAVVPSQWEEPFGLTCLEAMSMSLPVVTTDRGALPEIVNDQCAVVVPTGSAFVDALTQAVLTLYSQRDRCRQMGEAARLRALHFDKERYAAAFFSTLQASVYLP